MAGSYPLIWTYLPSSQLPFTVAASKSHCWHSLFHYSVQVKLIHWDGMRPRVFCFCVQMQTCGTARVFLNQSLLRLSCYTQQVQAFGWKSCSCWTRGNQAATFAAVPKSSPNVFYFLKGKEINLSRHTRVRSQYLTALSVIVAGEWCHQKDHYPLSSADLGHFTSPEHRFVLINTGADAALNVCNLTKGDPW